MSTPTRKRQAAEEQDESPKKTVRFAESPNEIKNKPHYDPALVESLWGASINACIEAAKNSTQTEASSSDEELYERLGRMAKDKKSKMEDARERKKDAKNADDKTEK